MANDLNTHIGPYLLTRCRLSEVQRTTRACPSGHTAAFGAFCQECGGKIDLRPVSYMEATPGSWELAERLDHALLPQVRRRQLDVEECVWVPNAKRPGSPPPREVDSVGGAGDHLTISKHDVEAETEWLRQQFAPEIRALTREGYSVEWRWGVVLYWT